VRYRKAIGRHLHWEKWPGDTGGEASYPRSRPTCEVKELAEERDEVFM
jgi:hypothetical protein